MRVCAVASGTSAAALDVAVAYAVETTIAMLDRPPHPVRLPPPANAYHKQPRHLRVLVPGGAP